MEKISREKQNLSFSDWMRIRFKGILDYWGAFFNRLGLMPNTMTFLGLLGNFIGAVLISQGYMTIGGLVILFAGILDTLDGTMARLRGMASNFGAFVDSVTDRYSELAIFGGLLFYYLQKGDLTTTMLVYVAASGSILVSYVRARGQSLGWDTKIGILTRLERYLVLAPSLIFNIPIIGLWIIAVFANFTALQRIVDVRRQAYRDKETQNVN